MHILVTGSNGMLGSTVAKTFKDHDLILTTSTDLDVRNSKQVMSYAKRKLDIILHLAALTDLTKAEFDPSEAYLTNHTGTQNMVELAKVQNIPLVYVSTAMVFNGRKKYYTEKDKPNPVNHYGKSKYYGELATRGFEKHYIIRNGWGFGGGPEIDKKFINKIAKQIQLGARKLYGITDIYGNPTYTIDFAKTIKNIIENKIPFGTYNCPGKGRASRFEVLESFVRFLGLDKKIELIPLNITQYLHLFPSKFPFIKSEVMAMDKLQSTGMSAMRDWHEALEVYAKEYKT